MVNKNKIECLMNCVINLLNDHKKIIVHANNDTNMKNDKN